MAPNVTFKPCESGCRAACLELFDVDCPVFLAKFGATGVTVAENGWRRGMHSEDMVLKV